MTEPPPPNTLVRHRSLLLVALGIGLYVACIGLRDAWYPDEPDIAEVAQAMFISGDWIAPRRMGVIWVDYPPLIYWAGSISSYFLGGMTEFALRLPSALGAIGLAVATCAVGSRWFDAKTGLWAGFLLMTFSGFAMQAIGYRTDMLFSLFIGTGLLVYASGVGERVRWGPRVAGFALLGLAMLTKGPLGLLLPGLVLTLWHSARRERRLLLELAPLSIISLAIYLPWFVACAKEMGTDEILYELWAQNFERFRIGSRGHERPFYYYLITILYDLAPWAPLLPVSLWWIHRAKLWQDRHLQLAIWWFVAFFVFLSFAATKRQLYLLPAYPAAALLIAPWITAVSQAKATPEGPDQRPARMFVAVLAILFTIVGVVVLIAAFGTDAIVAQLDVKAMYKDLALTLQAPALATGVIALAAGLWTVSAWRRGEVPSALFRIAVACVPLYLVGFSWFMPMFNPVKTYAPAGRWIREQIGSETHFGLVDPQRGHRKMGAFGFYSGALVELIQEEEKIERFLREHPKSLVLVSEQAVPKIYGRESNDWHARIVHELIAGRQRYFVLRGS